MKHIVYKDDALYRYLEIEDETVVAFAEGVFNQEFSSKEKAYNTYTITEFDFKGAGIDLAELPELDINE